MSFKGYVMSCKKGIYDDNNNNNSIYIYITHSAPVLPHFSSNIIFALTHYHILLGGPPRRSSSPGRCSRSRSRSPIRRSTRSMHIIIYIFTYISYKLICACFHLLLIYISSSSFFFCCLCP